MSNRQKITAPPPARATRQAWWQSPLVWVGALIVVAGVVVGIMAASQSDDADTTDVPQVAFAETIGASLPPFSLPDTAIGTPAPTASAQTFDGERVSIGADGTARLFGFFAHWCPHCQAEVPEISEWLAANTLPDGIEIVAVSTAVETSAANYPPSEWFERENWPTTVLVDSEDGALATGFGLTGFPYWVAVDGDGNVVERVGGQIDTQQFEALIASLAPV